jgi:hypothetical protein
MEIYKQLQVIFHCYQSVCAPLWLLLKQGEAVGNAFSNCKGISASPAREAVGSINVMIWNKKPFIRFQMHL